MINDRGFTLIEVLLAMVVFSMIAAASYAIIGPAGFGFQQLEDVRDSRQKYLWLGRQLRNDIAALTQSHYPESLPLKISNDNRGDQEFDQFWVLTRLPGQPGVHQVHYFLDETKGQIVREEALLWSRQATAPIVWEMGPADSLSIEMLDQHGHWQQIWQETKPFKWPKAIRVKTQMGNDDFQWEIPIFLALSW